MTRSGPAACSEAPIAAWAPFAWRSLAGLALLCGWAWLAHQASAGENASDLAVATACAPLLAAATLLLWRVGQRVWLVAAALALALVALAGYWSMLRQNLTLLYYLQHLGANLTLGVLFGLSLFGNSVPLITRFALLAHRGVLSAARARYTRQVTVAWTLFFAANAAVSSALFLWAAPAQWSVFANLLATPLLILMFAGEHLIRQRVLPPSERSGIADTLRAYRESLREKRALSDQP